MGNIIKQTPGPWEFDQENMKIKGKGDIEGRTIIANVSPKMDFSRGYMTQCANASLIAAAPELYEALIALRNWVGKLDDWRGIDPPCEIVDKAIEKATNRNSILTETQLQE